jgi:predicted phage terminase large subunit-like protein
LDQNGPRDFEPLRNTILRRLRSSARSAPHVREYAAREKSGELNDYSVCTTWGVINKKYFLLDVCRKRLDYSDLKREVQRLRYLHRPNRQGVRHSAHSGAKERGHYEVTSYAPPAGTDKIMRLNAQTAPFENGSVLLPRKAPWLADYIAELTGFPGSRHTDQVDSTTQALNDLRTTFARENWINPASFPAGPCRTEV